MFICLAEFLMIPWLVSWLMKTCSGCQFALTMVFVWNLWVREMFPQSENSQWWIVVQAGFLVWHCRTGCSWPADLGRYAPVLLILEEALTTAGRGTRVAASHCGLLVSLDFSCAHVALASPLPWPVLSMRWKRPISHLVYKVLNNYIWTPFPFAPYFSAKSEQDYMYLYRLLFLAMCLLLFMSSTHLWAYWPYRPILEHVSLWTGLRLKLQVYEFMTQNQTWTEKRREKRFSNKDLILSIAIIQSVKDSKGKGQESWSHACFPTLSLLWDRLCSYIITSIPGNNSQLACRTFLHPSFPCCLLLWM